MNTPYYLQLISKYDIDIKDLDKHILTKISNGKININSIIINYCLQQIDTYLEQTNNYTDITKKLLIQQKEGIFYVNPKYQKLAIKILYPYYLYNVYIEFIVDTFLINIGDTI